MASFALNPLTESSVPGVGSAPAGSAPRIQAETGGFASMVTGLASVAAQALPAFESIAQERSKTELTKSVKEVAMNIRGLEEGVAQGGITQLHSETEQRAMVNPLFEKYGAEEVNKAYFQQTGRQFDFIASASAAQVAEKQALAAGFAIMGGTHDPERAKQLGAARIQSLDQIEMSQKALTLAASQRAGTEAERVTQRMNIERAGMTLVGDMMASVNESLLSVLAVHDDALQRGDLKTVGDNATAAERISGLAVEGRIRLLERLREAGVSDPDSHAKIMKAFDDQAKAAQDMTLAGGKHLKNTLEIMHNRLGITAVQAAPLVAGLSKGLGIGDDALNGFLYAALMKPESQTRAQTEVDSLVTTLSMGTGTPGGEQNVKKGATLSQIVGILRNPNGAKDHLGDGAEKLFHGAIGGLSGASRGISGEENGLTIAKFATTASDYALLTQLSRKDIGTLVARDFGNPEILARLTELSKSSNDMMAGAARASALKIIQVASKSILEDARESTITLQTVGGMTGDEVGVSGSIRYDISQGKFVAADEKGMPPSQDKTWASEPIDRMNRALDIIVKFGALDPSLAKMGEKGIRESLTQTLFAIAGKDPNLAGEKFETPRDESQKAKYADPAAAANTPVPFPPGLAGAHQVISKGRAVLPLVGARTPPAPTLSETAREKAPDAVTPRPQPAPAAQTPAAPAPVEKPKVKGQPRRIPAQTQ